MSQEYKADLLMRLELAQWKLNCNKAMRSRGNISDGDKIYLELMAKEHELECKYLARECQHMTGETITDLLQREEK